MNFRGLLLLCWVNYCHVLLMLQTSRILKNSSAWSVPAQLWQIYWTKKLLLVSQILEQPWKWYVYPFLFVRSHSDVSQTPFGKLIRQYLCKGLVVFDFCTNLEVYTLKHVSVLVGGGWERAECFLWFFWEKDVGGWLVRWWNRRWGLRLISVQCKRWHLKCVIFMEL